MYRRMEPVEAQIARLDEWKDGVEGRIAGIKEDTAAISAAISGTKNWLIMTLLSVAISVAGLGFTIGTWKQQVEDKYEQVIKEHKMFYTNLESLQEELKHHEETTK